MLTLVFAVFGFGLLGSLLVLGGLSDHVGRRPVLMASIVLEAVALVLFLVAGDVGMLLVARVVQGAATGMALPALGATLVDSDPPHAPGRAAVVNGVVPIAGLAAGALACGFLAQYAPDPTHLVWELLFAALALALLVVFGLPESSPRRHGIVNSLVPRSGVPRRLRADVYALVPIIVSSWALGGLYLSLGPSVAATVFGISDHFLGGLVVTLLCGTGAVTAAALRRGSPAAVARTAMSLLAVGTGLTLVGVLDGSIASAIVGTVVSGVGYGASALASFGALPRLAGPADAGERAELFAVAYTVAFLAFSLPAVAAGYGGTLVGPRATVVVYSLGVILIGLFAFLATALRRRRFLLFRQRALSTRSDTGHAGR